jgi:hypothetical protein
MSKSSDSETASAGIKKIGVVRFLQLEPQKSGIEAILRSKYAMTVQTREDWETTVTNLLNQKVK